MTTEDRVDRAAAAVNEKLALSITPFMSGLAKQFKLNADELAVALSIALARTAAAIVVGAADKSLVDGVELSNRLCDVIHEWLREQRTALDDADEPQAP